MRQGKSGPKGKRHVRRLIERLVRDERFALALYSRLLRNVLECPLTGCWEWQRRRDPDGYGRLTVRVNGGSPVAFRVHVISWILFGGKFSARLVRAHKCDNPPCCRPDHIEQKSNAGNIDDSRARYRHSSYKNFKYYESLGDRGAPGPDVPF